MLTRSVNEHTASSSSVRNNLSVFESLMPASMSFEAKGERDGLSAVKNCSIASERELSRRVRRDEGVTPASPRRMRLLPLVDTPARLDADEVASVFVVRLMNFEAPCCGSGVFEKGRSGWACLVLLFFGEGTSARRPRARF